MLQEEIPLNSFKNEITNKTEEIESSVKNFYTELKNALFCQPGWSYRKSIKAILLLLLYFVLLLFFIYIAVSPFAGIAYAILLAQCQALRIHGWAELVLQITSVLFVYFMLPIQSIVLLLRTSYPKFPSNLWMKYLSWTLPLALLSCNVIFGFSEHLLPHLNTTECENELFDGILVSYSLCFTIIPVFFALFCVIMYVISEETDGVDDEFRILCNCCPIVIPPFRTQYIYWVINFSVTSATWSMFYYIEFLTEGLSWIEFFNWFSMPLISLYLISLLYYKQGISNSMCKPSTIAIFLFISFHVIMLLVYILVREQFKL